MAIRKDKTSVLMKVGIVLLALTFVVALIPSVFGALGSNKVPSPTQTQSGSDAAAAQYGPQVNSLLSQLKTNPKDYQTLVSLGNAYFEWALQVSKSPSGQSGADQPIWQAASDAYRRALAIKPGDPSVTTDGATATFYSGDVKGAIAMVEPIMKKDKTFTNAWANAAIYYEADGRPALAKQVLQEFLKNNPKSPDAAKIQQQLASVKSTATTGTATTTGTTTP